MKAKGIIFDVDGSLHPFDRGGASTFEQSRLSRAIKENIVLFFQQRFKISRPEAEARYENIKHKSNGELSMWLEKEYGIPRHQYFTETWDLDPQVFMDRDSDLAVALEAVTARRSILSNAPRIWIDRVTDFLQIGHMFDSDAVFSGEPNIRKPHPNAFLQIADFWCLSPEEIVAIGDQEKSDILPAKSLGMKTVRIGTNTGTAADFMAKNMTDAIQQLTNRGIL
jgi:putative hydrolase of the HAD superfamily